MLGKAMWFATVCTLAFAICGGANRDKGAADSQGTTEDLEHRLMQETNIEDHLSNTKNVTIYHDKGPWYAALRKLVGLAALSRAFKTADAFTSPGVQPSGVRPFQKVSNTAFAPRLSPGGGESAPSIATRIFSSGSSSEPVAPIAVGNAIPSVTIDRGFDPIGEVNMAERTKGKKVVILGLPGAFTPC